MIVIWLANHQVGIHYETSRKISNLQFISWARIPTALASCVALEGIEPKISEIASLAYCWLIQGDGL